MKTERPFPKDGVYIEGSARFIDVERTLVKVEYSHKDEIKIINIPADPEDLRFKYIIESCDDLDTIHQNTYRHVKKERIAFENFVMDIAKREGLLFDLGLGDSKSYKNFLVELFKPYEKSSTEDVNNLFAIKLDLFEIPQIRQSENSELKRELRRAQTPLDVVKAAIDIQLDNIKNDLEIQEEDT